MARAKANGQPMIPPAANSKVAARVRCLFFVLVGVNAYEQASIVLYMANEDGRKAVKLLSDELERKGIALKPTRRSIPHAGAEEHQEEIVSSNAIVNSIRNGPEESCLDQDGDCGQKYANSKESGTLFNAHINARKSRFDNCDIPCHQRVSTFRCEEECNGGEYTPNF
jgi:hypothetical protein